MRDVDRTPHLHHGSSGLLMEVILRACAENVDMGDGPWIATYIIVQYTQLDSCNESNEETFAMTTSNHSLDRNVVAAHVLRHLARAQARGRLVRLDEMAGELGVRREDIRDVVTSLHTEGHVDAKRMKLTMSGLAIASAMRACKLRDVRVAELTSSVRVA